MSRSKPLAYQSSKAVLEHISFGKRKHFYAICPAIRKMEKILPYHLELVELFSIADCFFLIVDSFKFCFGEYEGNCIIMINLSTAALRRIRLTCLEPKKAVEKFVLYNLSREGTRIKTVDLITGPEFIKKCIPIDIKNLIVKATSEWFPTNVPVENVELKMAKHVTVEIPGRITERINTGIVSEWNCKSIRIESWMKSEEVADYCNKVSKRTDRPIGSTLRVNHNSPVEFLFEILHSNMNARKTVLNGRKCATISIDESTELNVYGCNIGSYSVVVEVCASGTAVDQV
ncbi:hypothetical protein GCK72_020911 [Caenorhabditis remanei]|uniref:DUF38 domain-containing protein n=1 Tax=Caenorhabditis remanei TaxID=31234 RepID=A0A6A5GIC6_CAERE|nr:hypothetical protein GCK72_020911 [Caenorhabditis remanei]KAF1754351.1 hypothetical protein GCK72_020911 [Caenorhabditis remanei]